MLSKRGSTGLVWFWLLVILLGFTAPLVGASPPEELEFPEGWWFPTIGPGRGLWDLRVGMHIWSDKFLFRNLRWRGTMDLGPGLRANAVLRSNQEFSGITVFKPRFDELYLESYGFHTSPYGVWSGSLRVGRVRYLRFPYPDAIATFDHVPGVGDLHGLRPTTRPTGYSGVLLTSEYAHPTGLGLHFTGIQWGFDHPWSARDVIEAYAFTRQSIGFLEVEARAGILAVRPEPLGKGAPGFNIYAGYQGYGWRAGLLYEQIAGQPKRTGIMITFPNVWLSQAAGTVALDYTRSPQGIGLEIPLAQGLIGLESHPPAEGTLVGEIVTERLTTYWQNGQSRNHYEHQIGAWGETRGSGLVAVAVQEPWRLQLEALVSPNTRFNRQWERQRQGPAQLSQRVTYQYYQIP